VIVKRSNPTPEISATGVMQACRNFVKVVRVSIFGVLYIILYT